MCLVGPLVECRQPASGSGKLQLLHHRLESSSSSGGDGSSNGT